MPKYTVTDPEGKDWDVEGPEGSTPDQALSHFQSQWTPTPPQKIIGNTAQAGADFLGKFGDRAIGQVKALPGALASAAGGMAQLPADLSAGLLGLTDKGNQTLQNLKPQTTAPTGSRAADYINRGLDTLLNSQGQRAAEKAREAQNTSGASVARDAAFTGLTAANPGLGVLLGAAAPAVQQVSGVNESAQKAAAAYEKTIDANPANSAAGKFAQAGLYALIHEAPTVSVLGAGLASEHPSGPPETVPEAHAPTVEAPVAPKGAVELPQAPSEPAKSDALFSNAEATLKSIRSTETSPDELSPAQKSVLEKSGIVIPRPKLPFGMEALNQRVATDPNIQNDISSQQGTLPDEGPQPSTFDENGQILKPVAKSWPLPSRGNEVGPALPEPQFQPRVVDERIEGPLDGLLGKKTEIQVAPEATAKAPDNRLEWQQQGFQSEADYQAEVDAANKQRMRDALRDTGGVTSARDHAVENGGINGAGFGSEWNPENLGGDKRLANAGAKSKSPELMLKMAQEDGVVPPSTTLEQYRQILDENNSAGQKFESQNGAGALKSLRQDVTKNGTRQRFSGDERGAVDLGVVADAARKMLEAGKKLAYEGPKAAMAYDLLGDRSEESRYVRGALGESTTAPSDTAKLSAAIGAPLKNFAPDLHADLRDIESAKNQHLDPLKQVVQNVSDAARFRKIYTGPVKPEWVEAIREVEELEPKDKVYVTNGKLAALAQEGVIKSTDLPPELQRSVSALNQLGEHLQQAEGLPPEAVRQNYYPHTFTDPSIIAHMKSMSDAEREKMEFNENGTITVNDKHLLKRIGSNGWSLDPQTAWNSRINSFGRKVYDEPAASRIDAYIQKLGNATGPNKIVGDRLAQLRDEGYLGKPNAGQDSIDRIAMDTFKALPYSDAVRAAADKGDRSAVLRWMVDRGWIQPGALSDLLPHKGSARGVENEAVNGLTTGLLGLRIKTAARDMIGRALNVGDKEGYGNLAKGYVQSISDGIKSIGDPNYKTGLQKAGANSSLADVSAPIADISESHGFRTWLQRASMSPIKMGIDMDRGAAFEAAKFKADDLVKQGALPDTPSAREQYALGVVKSAIGEHGKLSTNPMFNAPGGKLAKMFTSTPQNYAMFVKELAMSPSDAKVGIGPAKITAGLARYLLVRGLGVAAIGTTGYNASKLAGTAPVTIPGTNGKVKIPVPFLGIVEEMFRSVFPENDYEGSPGVSAGINAVRLASANANTRQKATGKLGDVGLQALLGAGGIPFGGIGSLVDTAREMNSGVALGLAPVIPGTGPRRPQVYRISPGQSLAKALYLEPPQQSARNEAIERNASRQ